MISKIVTRRVLSIPLVCKNTYSISNMPTSEIDPGNIMGLMQTSSTPLMSFSQKLSTFSFSNMYHSADIFSRQLLFTLANDYAMGAGLSVIAISLGFKLFFLYPTLIAQVNGIKMKGMKKDLELFKQKMKIGQMTRNQALIKQARVNFNNAKKAKGIDNYYALINILQIPILLTWFLSLRQVFSLPELYPQLQTQGYLWFQDLSAYDPYFILPLLAAGTMSYSIAQSPNMASMYGTNPLLAPIVKYIKFMPFLSLPITAMFPAGLNLYWCTLSISQAIITLLMNNQYLQKRFGIKKQVMLQAKIMKAVIIQQKVQQDFALKPEKQRQLQQKSQQQSAGTTQSLKLLKNKPKKAKKTNDL